MFKIGDIVSYNQYICTIKKIKHNTLNNLDYYVMSPVTDDSLIIDVPVENKLGNIKNIMTKEKATSLIKEIPDIEVLDIDDKQIELKYKELLKSGDKLDLIRIIKTAYTRNDNRLNSNKKISEKDNNYLHKAEELLYSELSYSLSMSIEEVKQHIIDYCLSQKNNQ